MNIKEIKVHKIENGIASEVICADDNDCMYAFYLYKGGKRINTRWYVSENCVEFPITQTGVYRVVGFVKKNEQVLWKSSDDFFYSGGSLFAKKNVALKALLESDDFVDAWYSVEVSEEVNFSVILSGFDNKSPKNNFLTVFNGAVKRGGGVTPPFFSGVNLASQTNLPVVLFSDPVLELDSDITLGWYAGDYRISDFQKIVSLVVDSLSKKMQASPIFLGGSGGGFASLVALSLSSGGSAIIWNPQTNIDKYYKGSVDKYDDVAYPEGLGRTELQKREVHHTDFLKNSCQIVYLQNKGDSFHVERHANPFFDGLGVDANRFGTQLINNSLYILGDWKTGGHVSPPFESLIAIIDSLASERPLENITHIANKYLVGKS